MSPKEIHYFPHFSHTRHERRVRRLIKDLGHEGFSIWNMLNETLMEQPDMRYPLNSIDLLADDLHSSAEIIQKIIRDFDLFKLEEDYFYSQDLLDSLEPFFEKSRKGKAAAAIRWGKSPPENTNSNPDAIKSEMHMQGKSSGYAGSDKPHIEIKENNKKINKRDITKEEKNTMSLSQRLDHHISVWNDQGNLPECRYNSVNLPTESAMVSRLDAYSIEEIDEAIISLSKHYQDLEPKYRPKAFHKFMTNSVDGWVPGADPESQFQDQDSNDPNSGRTIAAGVFK